MILLCNWKYAKTLIFGKKKVQERVVMILLCNWKYAKTLIFGQI